jgi:hypothetical protein
MRAMLVVVLLEFDEYPVGIRRGLKQQAIQTFINRRSTPSSFTIESSPQFSA